MAIWMIINGCYVVPRGVNLPKKPEKEFSTRQANWLGSSSIAVNLPQAENLVPSSTYDTPDQQIHHTHETTYKYMVESVIY